MIIVLLHKKVYYKHVKPYPSFEQKRKEEGINDMRTLLLQHFSPCTYHAILIWRHRMNGLICIIFQAKPPLNLGRGRSRECHVITPQPIQVSLIMQKHDFGLFNVVRRARHGGRSKHLGVPVIIEGHLMYDPNIWGKVNSAAVCSSTKFQLKVSTNNCYLCLLFHLLNLSSIFYWIGLNFVSIQQRDC